MSKSPIHSLRCNYIVPIHILTGLLIFYCQWIITFITLPNNLQNWVVFWHTEAPFLSLSYHLQILRCKFMQEEAWKFCFYIYVSAHMCMCTVDECKCKFDSYPNIYLLIVSHIWKYFFNLQFSLEYNWLVLLIPDVN